MKDLSSPRDGVSIIIPTLNEEDYVGSLLKSLESQTFKNFEVIVVDGKSRDKTQEVVTRFSSKLSLRFIVSPKRGAAAQRNFGASYAKTDHLFFMDADVNIDPDFYEKLIAYLEKNSKIDSLSTWLMPSSGKKSHVAFFDFYNKSNALLAKYKKGVGVGAFLYMNKQAFEDAGGFDEKIAVGEDFDIFGRLYKKKYSFEFLSEPKIYFSTRRLEKMGMKRYLLSILQNSIYYSLRKEIKNADWLDYSMEEGGAHYKN